VEKSMNEADIAELMRLTFMLILKLSAPLLAVALIVGLVVAMLQAVTQINEATLVFIPKLLGIGAVLLFMGVSMFASLADFTHFLIDRMVATGGS
jgi:flagellar biosynthetic protein FliQ